MSTKSWYVLNTKAIPARYGLSKNIQILFQSYDHYKMGSIDAAELGRLVRTSPNRRTSLAATISKCAMILKKDHEEVKTCVDIIEMCTEILEIAGELLLLFGSYNAALTSTQTGVHRRECSHS